MGGHAWAGREEAEEVGGEVWGLEGRAEGVGGDGLERRVWD